MSRINDATLLWAGFAAVALAVCIAITCFTSCTIQPEVASPEITIGCVIVNLGQSQIIECPDAGGDAHGRD